MHKYVHIPGAAGGLYNQAEQIATIGHTSLIGAHTMFGVNRHYLVHRHQRRKVTPHG